MISSIKKQNMFTIEKFSSKEEQQARITSILNHEIFTIQNHGGGFEELKTKYPDYGFNPLNREYVFDMYQGVVLEKAIRRHNLSANPQWREDSIRDLLPNFENVVRATYYRGVIISYDTTSYDYASWVTTPEYYVIVPHDLPETPAEWVEVD